MKHNYFIKVFYLLLLLSITTLATSFQPLSGTYLVNSTGNGDFQSIDAAADALHNRNGSGQTAINMMQGAKSVDNPADLSKGQGHYSVSGELNKEFTSKTYFNDTSGIKAYGKKTMDNLVSIVTKHKQKDNTTGIVFYIYNNNLSGNMGPGTYQIKELTASPRGAMTFLTWKGGKNKTFATMFSKKKSGTITIRSRGANSLKGEFNNVKLAHSLDDSKTITLNGEFHAQER